MNSKYKINNIKKDFMMVFLSYMKLILIIKNIMVSWSNKVKREIFSGLMYLLFFHMIQLKKKFSY